METKLDQTTETAKITIDTTIKVDQKVSKEIELPYYFKSNYGAYCMITPDKKLIQARFYSNLICSITVTDELGKYECEEINSGKAIMPEDFFETLYSASRVIDGVSKPYRHIKTKHYEAAIQIRNELQPKA